MSTKTKGSAFLTEKEIALGAQIFKMQLSPEGIIGPREVLITNRTKTIERLVKNFSPAQIDDMFGPREARVYQFFVKGIADARGMQIMYKVENQDW